MRAGIVPLFLIATSGLATAVARRNESIMSNLVRVVLSRSRFNTSNVESSRVTQAPMVKMHLTKARLPLFFYQTLNRAQDEVRLQRKLRVLYGRSGASEIDSNNSKEGKLEEVDSMIRDMEKFQMIPLKMLNAHNFTEEELKKMPDNKGARDAYDHLFSVPHPSNCGRRKATTPNILIRCVVGTVYCFNTHAPSLGADDRTLDLEIFKTDSERFKIDLERFKRVSPAIERLRRLEDGRDRSGCYAIAQISGNPRWIEKGRYYDVYRLHQKVGKRVFLNRIEFFHSQSGWFVHGEPYLQNIRAVATILKHFRSPKMRTVKFRSKKHYKRTIGKRQEMTRILIDEFQVFGSGTNLLVHDPANFPLMKMRFIKQPSLELPEMKRNTVRGMRRDQLAILGASPLDNFDPIYNQLVIKEQYNNLI